MMCIEDDYMTNSQILQYLIQELGKTTLSWRSDKELFELICAPLSYGHEVVKKRKKIKESLLALFENQNFDKKKFHLLADNIICGENEKQYRQELYDFLLQAGELLDTSTSEDVIALIARLPCKSEGEKNYKNNFNNWKNGKTDRINCQEVKQRLEKNFHFAASLWEMNRTTIKQTIREGVIQFLKKKLVSPTKISNLFEEIRSEFNMKEEMTEKEKVVLAEIKDMPKKQIKEYIEENSPLSKSHSQEFIQALIPILYQEGCYTFLLEHVIEALDVHLQETNQIKKIKADILGSPEIGEYLNAFNILSTIESENDVEIVSMRTEAISNVRRHHLRDRSIGIKERQEIVQTLISYYEDTFNHKDTFHYYPAINLIYMLVIDAMLSEDKVKCKMLDTTINDVYKKCKPSIQMDKKSDKMRERYYAHIVKLELFLLKGVGSPIAELARFLELEESHISLIELTRTQRQMQCFIDIVRAIQGFDHPRLTRVQSAIAVIDDFMESRQELQ